MKEESIEREKVKESSISDYDISDLNEYNQILDLAEDVTDRLLEIRKSIEALRRNTILALIGFAMTVYLVDYFILINLSSGIRNNVQKIGPIILALVTIMVLFNYFSRFSRLESLYKRERHVATRLFNIISSYKDSIKFEMKALQKAIHEMRISRLEFNFNDDSPFLFSIIERSFRIFSRFLRI